MTVHEDRRHELAGPVRAITTRVVIVRPDGTEEPQHSQVEHFDDACRRTSVTSYKADGTFCSGTTFVYDESGRVREESHFNGPDGRLSGTERIHYDESGRVLERSWFDAEGQLQRTDRPEYRRLGARLQKIRVPRLERQCGFAFHVEGVADTAFSASSMQRIRILYDETGRARMATIRSRLGLPVGCVAFAYEASGRLREIAQFGWAGAYS